MVIPANTNYPDILGIVSRQRLSLDAAHVAFGVRPAQITAGRPFEALLLVQNNADCEIDVQVRLIVPAKDRKGTLGRFVTKSDKLIAIGLRAAEVGYVGLPVMVDFQTAPGDGYTLQIEVEIKRETRNPPPVRAAQGGTPIQLAELPRELQARIEPLVALTFGAMAVGRPTRSSATLTQPFTVQPPGISRLEEPARPTWHSLWTLHESLDDTTLAEQARPLTSIAQPQLIRQNVFFPLVHATQAACERAGYRLWAGEAVAIAKLLTLALEGGLPATGDLEEVAPYPRWFIRLCRVLLQTPDLARFPEKLATEVLYSDLIYDAAMSGFKLLSTLTSEDMGNAEEKASYAAALAQTLSQPANGEQRLDLAHIYLPLTIGGLIVHSRLIMPREQAGDLPELLVNARRQREPERTNDNQFVFDLFDQALGREVGRQESSERRYLDPLQRAQKQQPWTR
ncbi:MAG: hypothetical protein ACYDBJ_11100 [Aggregatilineales bacterium]